MNYVSFATMNDVMTPHYDAVQNCTISSRGPLNLSNFSLERQKLVYVVLVLMQLVHGITIGVFPDEVYSLDS